MINGSVDEISAPEYVWVKIKSAFTQIEDDMSVKKANFKWEERVAYADLIEEEQSCISEMKNLLSLVEGLVNFLPF